MKERKKQSWHISNFIILLPKNMENNKVLHEISKTKSTMILNGIHVKHHRVWLGLISVSAQDFPRAGVGTLLEQRP